MAHNKLLDYASKETMLSDTRELRKFIQEAVIKFDEVNCSEEVEETLQAIEDQREYEREARMEIIESESGVKIRDKGEILKLFQDTVEEIYTDAVNMVLCQDLAQNKMRSFATKLLTENRPSHTFFQSR